jgi:RNA polymerase sigma factor FliA
MTTDGELWRAYRRSRDPRLRDQLIEQHLGLVKYAAGWVAGRLPSHLRLDDLYSAGMLGYLQAIEEYDPDRGVQFSAYATPRIRGAIFDELRRLDCVPRRVRRKIREAQQASETLSRRLDREPTDEEVAGELQMTLADYQRLLGEGVTLLSLDAPANRDDGAAPLDTLEGSLPGPLAVLEVSERRALLARVIDTLRPRERQVLALYYLEELTMQEVGQVLGVTDSRVSQIHSSALLRLRNALRRHRLRPSDLGVAPPAPAGGGAARGRAAR